MAARSSARGPLQRIPIRMEAEIGEPSRWNTLRAMRVLGWYRG
jgi:hypothetical protein